MSMDAMTGEREQMNVQDESSNFGKCQQRDVPRADKIRKICSRVDVVESTFEPIQFVIHGVFVWLTLILEPGTFPEDVRGIRSGAFAFWVTAAIGFCFPSMLETMRRADAAS